MKQYTSLITRGKRNITRHSNRRKKTNDDEKTKLLQKMTFSFEDHETYCSLEEV